MARLRQAGSGDLLNTTVAEMEQWLASRREVAHEVEQLCIPIRATAPANWAETTEGRICAAAHDLAFFRYERMQGDGKSFHAGWK